MARFTQTHETNIVNAFLLRFSIHLIIFVFCFYFIYLFIYCRMEHRGWIFPCWQNKLLAHDVSAYTVAIAALHFGASLKHELQLLSQHTIGNAWMSQRHYVPYTFIYFIYLFFCFLRFFFSNTIFDIVRRLHLNIMQSSSRVIFFLQSKESSESGTMMSNHVIILQFDSRSLSILLALQHHGNRVSRDSKLVSPLANDHGLDEFHYIFAAMCKSHFHGEKKNQWVVRNSKINLLRSIGSQ